MQMIPGGKTLSVITGTGPSPEQAITAMRSKLKAAYGPGWRIRGEIAVYEAGNEWEASATVEATR